ncbi:heme-binding domain-containing protein [Albibacterium bauzanense]|uniref:Pentatricopeptide repeat protein n=1 Tax=Albibacterium bauzanense TaxID=653929 RepID=A0A4R1LTX4_9SPHI|nr:heme-binding domain-containing protein [Albibacterium bauzanense]TCK80583.1 pentatricopeptide repeat protein [Albibacterium bauzanense]
MKRNTRLSIWAVVIVAVVGIQFIKKSPRNVQTTKLATDITNLYTVPADVESVLQKSCYDCHSNNTDYPWYINVQPAAMFLEGHINDGKRHLNFSDFGSYNKERQLKKAEDLKEEMERDGMPLTSYTILHKGTKLNSDQRTLLTEWANSLISEINLAQIN